MLFRSEAALRAADEKATHKIRNTADYEEALWALADRTSDKRQIAEIYDSSYKWIMLKRTGRNMLTREQLNQRYRAMRKDSQARINAGFGSGWFAFRKNIMRGYLRLRAESQGIDPIGSKQHFNRINPPKDARTKWPAQPIPVIRPAVSQE